MRMTAAALAAMALAASACARDSASSQGEPPPRAPAAAPAPAPEPEPEHRAEPATDDAAILVGTWRASGSDGRELGWFLEYELDADGTFRMKGYPPITESGRWTLERRDGDTLHVRFHDRTWMNAPADPRTVKLELSADATSFAWDDRVFSRRATKPAD